MRKGMAGWLHGVCVSACCFVPPQCYYYHSKLVISREQAMSLRCRVLRLTERNFMGSFNNRTLFSLDNVSVHVRGPVHNLSPCRET